MRLQAEDLLAGRQFAAARAAFEDMLGRGEDAAALSGLAVACRALGDIPSALAALERAYQLHVDAGEAAEAGVVACTLADVELTHLGGSAVASGWLARARHHLGADPDHPGHVMLEALSAYRALSYEKNPDEARTFAEASLAHARRVGDPVAEIMSKAYLGFIDVSLGQLRDGFGLLDEATAAAAAGEIPPMDALDAYCVLITACERVRDFDRADQWARRVLRLASDAGDDGFAAFARTQYANVLIWRGRWDEADVELDRVLVDTAGQPLTAAVGMVLRASLRRRQGRLDDAIRELEAAEREPYRRAVRHLVLATRARIELDRGDAQAAVDLAERYLRAVSPSDLIERIEALDTLVRGRVGLRELEAAATAAAELDDTAAAIPTDGVRAAVLAARALVANASGDLPGARALLDEAVVLFDGAGLPHDAAEARLALAEVLLGLGLADRARRAAEDALAAARDLGAARDVTAAEALLSRVRREPPGAGDLTRREVEVLRLVADGRSNAEIAERLVLSIRTVERHLSNVYLKVGATGPSARMVAIVHARRSGLIE